MKNKLTYILLAAAVTVGSAVYFLMNYPLSKEQAPVQNTGAESEGIIQPENTETQARPEEPPTDGPKTDSSVIPVGNEIVTDDFQITPPPGWEGRPAPAGVLAIAINPGEMLTDQEAVKIGFKSYFAVTRDDLQGRTKEEYISFIGEELEKISSSVTLDMAWTTRVNEKDATVLDISMNRQNIDFKISLFLVWDGKDVWAISFNTTEDKWSEYKDIFFTSGTSFRLK